jgi:UDP-galactopyranose mutase
MMRDSIDAVMSADTYIKMSRHRAAIVQRKTLKFFMNKNLLVFSHLRWNFVYQRPQHLLSRLSQFYKVWYVEEPVESPSNSFISYTVVADNVTVCQPRLITKGSGFHDNHIPQLQNLIQPLVSEKFCSEEYLIWFYTPMALPLMQNLQPRAVIYDCMDELTAFLNAPKQLSQRESALLKRADVVFTGGISLYRSKSTKHPYVRCFPSSVEADHFAQARQSQEQHPAQRHLPHPRLGFFGVIDERIDFKLIEALADADPHWTIILVGPIVKISEQDLVRRSNIVYLGQREYRELPGLVAGWDVCLLPFALNEATRFISPTKTLEYMATGKPIVSTAIADVVELHGDIVAIAGDTAQFIAACRTFLNETPSRRKHRAEASAARVATTSWNSTVEQMQNIMDSLPQKTPFNDLVAANRQLQIAKKYDVAIIGAGPTGLSAAYHFGKGSLLVDSQKTVGGWCRSIQDGGYTFDHAGHIMFSNDAYVHQLYRKLLGDNVHWQDREAWIFSKDVYTRYPFQGALYGLPPAVLKECIVGAIEARFGSIEDKSPELSCAGKAESITDCCADGILENGLKISGREKLIQIKNSRPAANFEEFIYRTWGKGIAKHFAIPYNRKLWATPLSEMETSWLGKRVPLPNLEEMIEGALQPVAKPLGPNARFGYPLRGGFQALMNGFLPHLRGDLLLGAQVVAVYPEEQQLELADGRRFMYRQLISTAPLPRLIAMIQGAVPEEVRLAASKLRHISVRCVNLGISRANISDKHWIYYPEDTVFHRVFLQGNASPHCNAAGGFGLTCEITYGPNKPLPCDGEALIERCIADCIAVRLLREDDVVAVRNQVDMPYAYIVYDHARSANFNLIQKWLSQFNIILSGRYGQWQYYNSDHAFLAGKHAADLAAQHLASHANALAYENH